MIKKLITCAIMATYDTNVAATTLTSVKNYSKSPVAITTTSPKLVLSERVVWGSAGATDLATTGLSFQSDIYPTSMFAGINLDPASLTAINQYTIRIVPSALVTNETVTLSYSSGSIVFVQNYGITARFTDPRRVQFSFDLLSLHNIATATLFTINIFASGPSLAGRNVNYWSDMVGVTGTTTLTGQSMTAMAASKAGQISSQLQRSILVPEPTAFALFGIGATISGFARRHVRVSNS